MNVFDLVGDTPLVDLGKLNPPKGVKLSAKAEFLNPSGSVKDRAAKAMLLEGLKRGALGPEKTIIDATSGNTGVAYAMLGAYLGLRVTLHLPANANLERKALLTAYGATIVETDPLESSDGAYLSAKRAYEAEPDKYFFPDQYNNAANPRAHYETTGPEIWRQTAGSITHFICSLGTSGTFMGSAKFLKEKNPHLKTLIVQPDSPFHGIEGSKHMASTIKPGIYDESWVDGVWPVSTEEAWAVTRRLARECGLLVGISSGANVAGALKLAATLPEGSSVVTILGDSGSRYLSDEAWNSAN
ncbi:MAG: PLP-dependent cysteine synthase family protein [Deltaproteobacteria bacterium]|jgi:cysteine synthase B|nr:PLP-dependent cysteine synthase family protein [Deltaproteobacteria bacterium]